MNPLERKNLPVRLADEIERAIRAGEWTVRLPGHRTLMKTYAVSAKTCIAAIAHLQERGLVSSPEQGKRHRILLEGKPATHGLETLLMLDDMSAPSGGHRLSLQAYAEAWEETGGRVVSLRFDFPRYRHPGHLLREAVATHRADALYLQVATAPWVRAAARLRPTYLDGGEWGPEKNYTGVGFKMGITVGEVARALRALGHERIAVPLELVGPIFEAGIRTHLAEALELRDGSSRVAALSPVFPEGLPEAWLGYWKKLFASTRPTAVIVTKDLHFLSLQGFCTQHGIAIPRDVSVVCLESTDALAWCSPVPTRMRFPIEEAILYFKKWIRGGCRPLGTRVLPMEQVPGATVAPPR
ncbi:substrate-binding domain-containing protein [Luteolibacter sp. LG18]|uniref:substrate-binding domain-containing protein n=1 Tax=Luteolibacter sp. LG18 TaxID=2819286 RepID=UPI002B2D5552|nr:hypothetical protein llg_26390 [Luteolibacter sp. LG18]